MFIEITGELKPTYIMEGDTEREGRLKVKKEQLDVPNVLFAERFHYTPPFLHTLVS